MFEEVDGVGGRVSAAVVAPAHGGEFGAAGWEGLGIVEAVGDGVAARGAVVEGFDLGVDPGFAGCGLAETAAEAVFFEGCQADSGFLF